MNDEEFYLITPEVLIEFKLCLVGLAIGSIPLLFNVSFLGFLEPIIVIIFMMSLIFSVIFGILVLIGYDDISRFKQINKIVISGWGFSLYKRDGSTANTIPWHNIKSVEVRGMKKSVWGVEVDRKPVAVTLNLIDGDTFVIPLHIILKDPDSFRMVSILQSRFYTGRGIFDS